MQNNLIFIISKSPGSIMFSASMSRIFDVLSRKFPCLQKLKSGSRGRMGYEKIEDIDDSTDQDAEAALCSEKESNKTIIPSAAPAPVCRNLNKCATNDQARQWIVEVALEDSPMPTYEKVALAKRWIGTGPELLEMNFGELRATFEHQRGYVSLMRRLGHYWCG